MRMRVFLLTALCVLTAGATIVAIVLLFPGDVNSLGGQPTTACTVETVRQDCRKLNCINKWNVWYCDRRGASICYESKCTCAYGCL